MQYISIGWDIKAVPYIIVRYSDGVSWHHVPVRVLLHFQDSWSSAWVWLLFFFCGQSFETLWKRVIIREAGQWLPYAMVKKERSSASTSPTHIHGVHRDSFNTIEIGIVTD